MKYTAYHEQNEWIDYEQYEAFKETLASQERKQVEQDVTLRKVSFANEMELQERMPGEETIVFSVCMKNGKDSELYVEKKVVRNQIVFKSFARITRKEAECILAGKTDWMEQSRVSLIREFYNELTINGVKPCALQEVEKDVFGHIKGTHPKVGIVFKKSLRQSVASAPDFFVPTLPMVDCYNCDRVLMSYKKSIEIPSAVSNIIHMHSAKGVAAYSL